MAFEEKIKHIFKNEFRSDPILIRAPGRINLIGEHTDYNKGFVLPAAINLATYFAIDKSKNNYSKIISVDLNDSLILDIKSFKKSDKEWANYILGVLDQLKKKEISIGNFNLVFGGDIPIGAGLSSSAALETGFLFALDKLFNLNMDKLEIIQLSQNAEHEFVGVKCGIMDQFASVTGSEKKVILLDCRSLEYKYYPFEFEDVSILLFDTGVSHSLASSEYNKRRNECDLGVNIINKTNNNIKSLRDVPIELLEMNKEKFSEKIYNRCKYIISENDRVLRACEYLNERDLISLGKLMYESHQGLRNDYEVSCKELDFLVDEVIKLEGVYGARMMGGGFGGCTINIVRKENLEKIRSAISEKYYKKFKVKLKTYKVNISGGTSELIEEINSIF